MLLGLTAEWRLHDDRHARHARLAEWQHKVAQAQERLGAKHNVTGEAERVDILHARRLKRPWRWQRASNPWQKPHAAQHSGSRRQRRTSDAQAAAATPAAAAAAEAP